LTNYHVIVTEIITFIYVIDTNPESNYDIKRIFDCLTISAICNSYMLSWCYIYNIILIIRILL